MFPKAIPPGDVARKTVERRSYLSNRNRGAPLRFRAAPRHGGVDREASDSEGIGAAVRPT